MQGGARYQNQVTAWLAAKMLAERPAAPILSRGKLTYIAAESGEAVDDVLAGNDLGTFAFVQAKANDLALIARGLRARRSCESSRQADCRCGRAGEASMVERH